MLGEILARGSYLAQQKVASLGSSAVAAREHALGLGVAAAETAAQKFEGVARELRERGRRGNHQVDEQRTEDANLPQDDAGIGSNQTCRYASQGMSMPMQASDAASASGMPMGLLAEREAFLAVVEAAEAAELSSSSTLLHPCSSTTLPSDMDTKSNQFTHTLGNYSVPNSSISVASTVMVAPCAEPLVSSASSSVTWPAQGYIQPSSSIRPSDMDTISNLFTHTSGNYSVPNSSISVASTVMVAPCAEPLVSSASSSVTLPAQGYIQPSSSISLASTVMVPPVTEVQASASSKVDSDEAAQEMQPASTGTHHGAQVERDQQDVGQGLQTRQSIQPGTWLEVCCIELGSWRVGCIVECFEEHELFIDVLNANGSLERNRFARVDLFLAALGTHVQTPPPGFESRPSVSRPGKLTYTSLASGANYQFLEHAWQEYFNTVARLMHASTSKVLQPEACEAIRERLLKEVEQAREAMPTDDLVAFPTRELAGNTALANTSPIVAQPTVLLEPTISFNASAAASAAALVAPLPAVPRPGRLSAPAVLAASSATAHGGNSQARSMSQPHFAQPQLQPQIQPQLQLTLPQTHVHGCRWQAMPQHATSVHVQVHGGSKTGVPVIPATVAGSVTARGWPAVTARAPAVRA